MKQPAKIENERALEDKKPSVTSSALYAILFTLVALGRALRLESVTDYVLLFVFSLLAVVNWVAVVSRSRSPNCRGEKKGGAT